MRGNRFFNRTPLFLIAATVALLLYLGPSLRGGFVAIGAYVQRSVLEFKEAVSHAVNRHFRQIETIRRLKKERDALIAASLRCQTDATRYRAMVEALGGALEQNISVLPVRAGGYVRLGSFQKVWLTPFEGFDYRRSYGLIRGGKAVGIVVGQNRRPMAILAGDRECGFAVYVGPNRAPGIAMGEDARHMVVRYIPEWMRISPGQRVFTSGLDRVFPAGVPVGEVLEVRKMQGFKNARIRLYGDTLHPDYFWVIRSLNPPTRAR